MEFGTSPEADIRAWTQSVPALRLEGQRQDCPVVPRTDQRDWSESETKPHLPTIMSVKSR